MIATVVHRRPRTRLLAVLVLTIVAGCQTPQKAGAPTASPGSEAQAQTQAAVSFSVWLDAARREALERGISPGTVASALSDLTPNPRVVELDRRQPEFNQTFWHYLDNAVSDNRVAQGRALMQRHAVLLAQLEKTYGVPGRILVAFWGLETDFGRNPGDFPVVRSLATLAYDGRRGAYFRGEMFHALTILDHGDISVARMTGSWAGAMGQTQFMPSTFLKYAVDQDRDGRKDIWDSVPDALGSTANYLQNLGWDGARGWGREVTLPPGFDPALASLDTDATETVKTLAQWNALGIRRADGAALPNGGGEAALILPAGVSGPAFLVQDNYRVILKFNRSTSYALAIGYLADRLGGGERLAAKHRADEPIRRDDALVLQQGLAALGFLKGAPDGAIGAVTRQAVRAFQKANGFPPDGYVDPSLIAAVRARSGMMASS